MAKTSRMGEIIRSFTREQAPLSFMRELVKCDVETETDLRIELKAEGADDAMLAHAIGAHLVKHCRVNLAEHEHNIRHRCTFLSGTVQ